MNQEFTHDCCDQAKEQLSACPSCVHEKIDRLRPGASLQLLPGEYKEPIVLSGLRGLPDRKITLFGQTRQDNWLEKIEPQPEPDCFAEAVLTSGIPADRFKKTANRNAALKQAAGGFPGLYFIADEAYLYLRDCQHVVVRNLYFDECWPTAIYLDNCQDIDIQECQFRWGTYAIGATGFDTRHISVEDCRWQQNPDNVGHWKEIPWHRIHGHTNNAKFEPDFGKVNIDNDSRHFDGDFFVAWRIAGFVKIRRNLIQDAFNGIHLFNIEGEPSTALNCNVLIEGNRFERIRDNAIEPEFGAWHWVVRHNVLMDVYSWFSLDMSRSGWFYVYGNLAWHTQEPGPGENPPDGVEADQRTGGVVFKLPKRNIADGPHYFFHNSFYLRERLAKKKRLAQLKFFNNAILYCRNGDHGCDDKDTLFAANLAALATPHAPDEAENSVLAKEKARFTKDWETLEIQFYSNLINGPDTARELTLLGYSFGENSLDADPGFRGLPPKKEITAASFVLGRQGAAKGWSAAFELETQGPQTIAAKGGCDIGACQEEGHLFELPAEFIWIKLWDKRTD